MTDCRVIDGKEGSRVADRVDISDWNTGSLSLIDI